MSEMIGVIVLIMLTIAAGVLYLIDIGHTMESFQGTLVGQMDNAILRAKQMLELEWYNQSGGYTSLWLFPYGSTPITVLQVRTTLATYNSTNFTVKDLSGTTITSMEHGNLYILTFHEEASAVDVMSTLGGRWSWGLG
jgi:hypothetical protein